MVSGADNNVNSAFERQLLVLARDIIGNNTLILPLSWCRRFGLEATAFMACVLDREVNSTYGWATFRTGEVQEATSITPDVQQGICDVLATLGVLVVQLTKKNGFEYKLNWVMVERFLTETPRSDGPLNGPLVPSEVLPSHTLSTPNSPIPPVVPPSLTPEKKAIGAKRQNRPIPDDFKPSDRTIELVLGYPFINQSDIGPETLKFVNYHAAKGNVWKDHEATFRTWMANLSKFRLERRPTIDSAATVANGNVTRSEDFVIRGESLEAQQKRLRERKPSE